MWVLQILSRLEEKKERVLEERTKRKEIAPGLKYERNLFERKHAMGVSTLEFSSRQIGILSSGRDTRSLEAALLLFCYLLRLFL